MEGENHFFLQGVFSMVGAEDSPAHQHPTLSFASALGDVLYEGLSITKHPLLRIFCGLFCSNVPICCVSNQNACCC